MVLADKANAYAVKVSASSSTHSEAKLYYGSCYLKIQQKHGKGNKRWTDRTSKHCYDLSDWRSRYGTSNFFLRHTQSDSQATQLVKIAFMWAQHQCGWHESILTNVTTVLPHFEAQWLRAF
eukprot:1338038-Ditylum_brightwellii.AAC.1